MEVNDIIRVGAKVRRANWEPERHLTVLAVAEDEFWGLDTRWGVSWRETWPTNWDWKDAS